MGNGKTQLWSRLVYGTDQIETVTSMVENKITLNWQRDLTLDEKTSQDHPSSTVCLVDTPGHPRLSCRSLARNLPSAQGIIFVIDSQIGLTGKGLRDTSGALELVLSLLQILYHRNPDSRLPELSIHLSNSARNISSSKPTSEKDILIQKTRVTLIKELNRRKITSSNHSGSSGRAFRQTRLESLEAIPSSEFNTFLDVIKRLFRFKKSIHLPNQDRDLIQQSLPEEQLELTKLLEEEEEEKLSNDEKLLNPLDRYEKLIGHQIHWTIAGQGDEDETVLIKNWMIDL